MNQEFLRSYRIAVTDADSGLHALDFEAKIGKEFPIQLTGFLRLNLGSKVEVSPQVTRIASGFMVRTQLPDLDQSQRAILHSIAEELPLQSWIARVLQLPVGLASFKIELNYEKHAADPEHSFIVIGPEGLDAVREHHAVLLRLGRGGSVIIRTPMAMEPVEAKGITITPLPSTLQGTGDLGQLPIDLPVPFRDFATWLAWDFLTIRVLNRQFAVDGWEADGARQLLDWLAEHPLRLRIAQKYIQDDRDTAPQASALLPSLRALETDLISDSIKSFQSAKATFQEITIDLIGKMQGMRNELLTLVGRELFQTSVSLAITIAGFKLAQVLEIASIFRIALVVGILFFVGSTIKAVTQEKAFRQLIDFHVRFAKLPIATAMPEFAVWYRKSVNQSLNLFYVCLVVGVPISAVPLMGILAIGAGSRAGEPWVWFAGLLATSLVTSYLVWWRQRPARLA